MSVKQTIILCVFLSAAGCSASLPVPSDGDSGSRSFRGKTITTEELRADRDVYIRKCSGCHGLYLPEGYTGERWKEILPAMNEKARSTPEESHRIERYLLSYSFKKSSQ